MSKVTDEMRIRTLKEAMLVVAKRMLVDGELSLEVIAKYAGLSVEEVEKLKESTAI